MRPFRPKSTGFARLFKTLSSLSLAAACALPSLAHAQESQPGKKQAPGDQCHPWRLTSVEYDIFAPPDRDGAFRATDLSTMVISNTGVLPVKVSVEYYFASCLEKAENAETGPIPCQKLDSKELEVYPTQQTISIASLGTSAYGDQKREIAYRVLVQYMDYSEFYVDTIAGQLGIDFDEALNYLKMEVFVDFYRNLKLVDCKNIGGIPDYSDKDVQRSLIQSVKYTNYEEGPPSGSSGYSTDDGPARTSFADGKSIRRTSLKPSNCPSPADALKNSKGETLDAANAAPLIEDPFSKARLSDPVADEVVPLKVVAATNYSYSLQGEESD